MEQTLFDLAPEYPKGFQYLENFISMEEERVLLKVIGSLTLKPMIFQGFQAKRKVESYGYDYHFDSRKISPGKPVPQGIHFLVDKVADCLQLIPEEFQEVLLTEYPPGAVINWHRDAPPFELVAGISLYSDCILRLRPYDKARQDRKSIQSIPVRRCSLYVLEGQVRSDWEHSTMPVRETRFSITLRTLRKT